MTETNSHSHATLIAGFDLESASRMLRSMSNDRRLVILLLLRGKEMSVNDIAERVGLSQSALSQHLAIFRRAGEHAASGAVDFLLDCLRTRRGHAR
jgi:predicted transcriptional regulator